MAVTRLYLIRHALVEESARAMHYGTLDVDLCAPTRMAQGGDYAALARSLPVPARWLVSPLARTRQTAEAIFAAGYPPAPLTVEPGLLEQDIGRWAGLPHDALAAHLQGPAHPFWPMAVDETPPGGESMDAVLARVGAALEAVARRHAGQEVVAVTHGGAIRAAVAHAMGVPVAAALRLAIDNLSLTILERVDGGWRVQRINEVPLTDRGEAL